MSFMKTGFPGFLKDPKRTRAMKEKWRAGEFRLALQGALEKRPNWATKVKYGFIGLLYKWTHLRGGVTRIFGRTFIASQKHVRAALEDESGRFQVVAGHDQEQMFGKPANLMGVEGAEHSLQREVYRRILLGDGRDVAAEVRDVARETANALLDDARGRIDVLEDLLVPVLFETVRDAHGIPREDPNAYMTWTTRAAEQFALPDSSDEISLRKSFESARRMRLAHDREVRQGAKNSKPGSTLRRMFELRDQNVILGEGEDHEIGAKEFLDDDHISNMLAGFSFTLVTQYFPMAIALNRILSKGRLRELAISFAENNKPEDMRAMVKEYFRLHPATYPWVARKVCLTDGASAEFGDRYKLRHGETVVICIPAALRDPKVWRNPSQFDHTRTHSMDLAFGAGPHACMGQEIAETVATEIFMALFARSGVCRAGPMVGRVGEFIPARLPVTFEDPAPQSGQEVVTALIPFRANEKEIASVSDRMARSVLAGVTKQLGRKPLPPVVLSIERKALKRATLYVHQKMRRKVLSALETLDAKPAGGGSEKDLITQRMIDNNAIHGFCVTVADMTVKKQQTPHLIVECNIDSADCSLPKQVDAFANELLGPSLSAAGWSNRTLKSLFEQYGIEKRVKLFGNTGMGVYGLPEASVAEIQAERELAQFAREKLVSYCANCNDGNVPIAALDCVRQAVLDKPPEEDGPNKGLKLSRLLLRPRARAPGFASHQQEQLAEALKTWAKSARRVWALGICLLLLITVPALWATMQLHTPNWFVAGLIWIGFSICMTVFLAVTAWLIKSVVWQRILSAEKTDDIDERQPFLEDYSFAMGREDNQGHEQNHMAILVKMKPGFIRRVLFAVSLLAIKWMNVHWFRPGWAQDIGTIRHLRVVRAKGASEALLLACFDGSWSSYIGQFSDRATIGMTLFWGNFTGSPRAQGLINDGARDDERFKRWIRTRQVPASIVRQRFPDMTNDGIRRNALIREGLARVLTRSEAERWMRLFGSDPRAAPDMIEPDEMQTIVLKGLGRFPASACVGIEIADGQSKAFRAAVRKMMIPIPEGEDASTEAPMVSFGEEVDSSIKHVATVALSASGLEKLDVPADGTARPHKQLYHFPMPFVEGMGRRARTLGDPPPCNDKNVDWIDRRCDHTATTKQVDAVFLIGAPKADIDGDDGFIVARETAIEALKNALGSSIKPDPKVVSTQIMTEAPKKKFDLDDVGPLTDFVDEIVQSAAAKGQGAEQRAEVVNRLREWGRAAIKDELQDNARKRRKRRRGLGFADGVSQPLLAGAPGVPEDSPFQIAPGEIILGLPDEKGLRAPSPEVPAGWDLHNDLPDIEPLPVGPWPDFAAPKSGGRDLGRHGTFMVIRELQVNGDDFQGHFEGGDYSAPPNFGDVQNPDDEQAKIIGRRRDGSPLGSPSFDTLQQKNAGSSDMVSKNPGPSPRNRRRLRFKAQDPWGYDVPLGSHVRRAHPRDSLGDAAAAVQNRHRIIRRSRPFLNEKNERDGLLFVCLNASIERQFEFVQQTWLNARNFHGLFDEPDPLMGRGKRKFTIPSPEGPREIELDKQWVTFRGGGYFFVPSKSALRALMRSRG